MELFTTSKDVHVVGMSDWLNWACEIGPGPFIALPMIQRGSVWRPQQVIELWDSLLQGMPIGSMMVSRIGEGISVRRPGSRRRELTTAGGGLALIDGQQRTLAMLIAWSQTVEMDRRVWVDFADKPAPGQLLRLRVTTENQPFGFKISEPSTRLSLGERRRAHSAFEEIYGREKVSLEKAWPFASTPSLPVDLRRLIHLWCQNSSSAWLVEVAKILHELDGVTTLDREEGTWKKVRVWETLGPEQKDNALRRVYMLSIALSRLLNLELPLIRVDERFFNPESDEDSDPPLATLFKRIGTGGTPLSDADYVYSVIKHLRPEAYDLVETLQQDNKTVASLLTSTDLVMSTVRLAAVGWTPADGKPVPDMDNPSKRDFHRLLRRGDFIGGRFLPLLQPPERPAIAEYFNQIQSILSFRDDMDNGLPRQAFPLLKRPLVQVLLLLAEVGYLQDSSNSGYRNDVLRLVMYWLVAVTDQPKATRLAYEEITNPLNSGRVLGKIIRDRLIAEWAAVRLPAPEEILDVAGMAISANDTGLMRGESRFDAGKYLETDKSEICAFYRNQWWRPWTYQHPILLWLQRKMIAAKFDGSPIAGRDEDTLFDYDHIVPYSHWGSWTGVGKGALPKFADGQIHVIGNGIGNVRVWGSSLNCSDGDKSPLVKLKLDSNDSESLELLQDSVIAQSEIEDWRSVSASPDKSRIWNQERALAFQRAVERRTVNLYRDYYDALDFSI